MDATNTIAHELEGFGVRTFSAKEMSFNILGLMHPLLFSITQVEPIWADLNGGMDRLPDLADVTTKIRMSLQAKSALRRAIAKENAVDFSTVNGSAAEQVLQTVNVTPRANFKFEYPKLESPESLADMSKLRGLIDLDQVVVVTGFAEVGPWGSSRTRWEMEARGQFTIEGCIEMAWMMGYIKHFDGRLKNGSLYVGWVDSKTEEPIDDKDVRARYERDILEHAGVRLLGAFFFSMNPASLMLKVTLQNLSSSVAMILRRRYSTKRLRFFMTSSHSKLQSWMLSATSTSMATNAIYGRSKAVSGSSSSRRVPESSFPRPSSSAVPLQVRSQLVGVPAAMAFPPISSLRPIAPRFGLSFAQLKHSTTQESLTHTSCTSICILPKSVPALVVVWVVWRVCKRCSKIDATRRRYRMTSCRKRTFSGPIFNLTH
jgi:hypothetical protein